MEKRTGILAEQTALKLKNYILENDLRSGKKIPSEPVLAEMMNVGRGTIREAVKILASRNILSVRHGSGTFIAENIGMFEDPLGFAFIKDRIKLTRDLLEIRMIIEPSIAALAAKNATDENIKELKTICLEIEELLLADKNYIEKDILFHKKIAESSKNLVIPNLFPIISQAVDLFTKRTSRKLTTETIETHRAILEAIQNHDSMGAHDAMYLHLVYNRNLLEKIEKLELDNSL